MKAKTKRALARAGWKVGSATELLKLTPAEAALVDLRLRLVDGVRALRARQRLSQTNFAQHLNSSQAHVARLEAGDSSASLDLLLRTLLTLGATKKEIAKLIAS